MNNDVLKAFGNRVRELRLTKKWSQERLAEKTDFHRTYIGMIERGERNISLKNIYRLAKDFDIKIENFFLDI
ncbi:MAG: helix-turn-helix domain-containing protein [Flavobacteriaceae bacterium]|nr:MAG: helix-turn-helix domain-containing protein [Flavobacteriaceae bacterium]